jgi:HEAT repeat protein
MKNSIFYILALAVFVQIIFLGQSSSISEKDINRLITQLGTRDWQAAVDSLADIGEPAVEALIKTVRSENPEMDWPAARACYPLADIGTGSAIETVSQTAADSTVSIRRRRYAIQALGLYNVSEKTDLLISLLQDKNKYIADPAAHALGQIGTPEAAAALAEVLPDRPHYSSISDISRTLAKTHPALVTHTAIQSLNTDYYWPWLQSMQSLVDIGEPAVSTLIQNINHDDFLTRLRIIRILGKIGSAQAAPGLVKVLSDEDWMIRNEATVALAKINSYHIVEQLKGIVADSNLEFAHDDVMWLINQLEKDKH